MVLSASKGRLFTILWNNDLSVNLTVCTGTE